MIPFLNLEAINATFKKDFLTDVEKIISSGLLLQGENVRRLEHDFARFCGVLHCSTTGSGLSALQLPLLAWLKEGRLKTGDEVIVPANSFIASALAVSEVGLVPVFAEPCERTHLLSLSKVKASITPRTRVILPVHLYGQICPMDEICGFSKANNLLVLEDCAQAHGAKLNGKSAGAWGDAGAFSFYPGKNLGGLTDGGAIVSNDKTLIERCSALKNYGSFEKYVHDMRGHNSRLSEISAAFLLRKLKIYDNELDKRRYLAEVYHKNLNETDEIKLIQRPDELSSAEMNARHLLVIRTSRRAELQKYLTESRIGWGVHYPIPIYRQKAYQSYGPNKITTSDSLSDQILSLPIGSHLTKQDVERVCNKLNYFFAR